MGGNRYGNNFYRDGRKDFYQHDDRSSSDNYNKDFNGEREFHSGRREQYQKRGNFRGEKNFRGRGGKMSLNNEDVFMSDGKSRHQQMYDRKGRGGFRARDRSRGGRVFIRNNYDWNKIILKEAGPYPKEDVLNRLRELVEEDFVPIMIEIEGGDMVFYLEKSEGVAKAIKELSGRLILGKKHRIIILSIAKPPPERKLTEPHIEIIKKVMATRFSPEMNRLDLKRFHYDQTLIKEQIFCPLNRRQCLSAVVEIIIENCSHVEEIDLSWNELHYASALLPLKKCSSLKRLYLEKNKFRVLNFFNQFKGFGIIELSLEGNPLCNRYKEAEAYVNAVRELFPRLERLDGMDLPKPITFEVEENIALPPTKPSYFCSEEVRAVILQFVQQYYQIFESSNRSALQAAYTDDALFSLSAYIPENAVSGRAGKWIEFDNRNMKKVFDSEKRQKLLYKGREEIIKVLNKMPQLTHDPNSFVIDIPFAKPCLIHVIVTGIFKQICDKNIAIRNFMKSLIIVPVGSGFCIANEELLVNVATIEQIRKAFKEPASGSEPSTSGASTSSDPMASLDSAKIELVKSFSVNTKMLPQYCIMCLENNNWDFQKAGELFLSLQAENKIPPEYFGPVA